MEICRLKAIKVISVYLCRPKNVFSHCCCSKVGDNCAFVTVTQRLLKSHKFTWVFSTRLLYEIDIIKQTQSRLWDNVNLLFISVFSFQVKVVNLQQRSQRKNTHNDKLTLLTLFKGTFRCKCNPWSIAPWHWVEHLLERQSLPTANVSSSSELCDVGNPWHVDYWAHQCSCLSVSNNN